MTSRVVSAVADSGPVVVLAGIAAAGSFTHIRDTAHQHGQHGWMGWAIAVCIDLTCVMAARERHRDQRTGRRTGPVSWPTVVLTGGILLSLAANLAQADPTVWGWVTAGTPAAAFLVAVSMLERRTTQQHNRAARTVPVSGSASAVPPSFGHPSPAPSVPSLADGAVDGARPQITVVPDPVGDQDEPHDARDGGQTQIPIPGGPPSADRSTASAASSPSSSSPAAGPPRSLVEFARRVATEHHTAHGRPITRDALRARLGVSNQLASDLLRQIRTTDHQTA